MITADSSFKKDSKYEQWRFKIFGITWLAYAGFYLTRASFSVAKIGIAQDPGISLSVEQMGIIDGIYLTGYAIGQFVWGILGDKVGTRKIVLGGLLASIIAGFAMGVSSVMLAFGVFSLVQGLSQSTGWAPLAKNITSWFSLKERGVVMGWWATNYTIGGLVGAPIAGLAAAYFLNWRFAFFIPSIILLGVFILFYFIQKNKPEDVGLIPIEEYHKETVIDNKEIEESEESLTEGSWKMTLTVLKNPMVLLLGAMYFFLKPIRYAILFWGPLFVSDTLGTGMVESAFVNGAFFIAGPLSVLAGGYASDKLFQSRRMPYAAISMMLLAVLLFFFDDIASIQSTFSSASILFLAGFLIYGPDSLVSATAAVDFGTSKGASTASGVINGMGSIGAIVGGTIPGFFKATWGWNGVFVFMSVSVFIAGLLMISKWNSLPDDANNKNDD